MEITYKFTEEDKGNLALVQKVEQMFEIILELNRTLKDESHRHFKRVLQKNDFNLERIIEQINN